MYKDSFDIGLKLIHSEPYLLYLLGLYKILILRPDTGTRIPGFQNPDPDSLEVMDSGYPTDISNQKGLKLDIRPETSLKEA